MTDLPHPTPTPLAGLQSPVLWTLLPLWFLTSWTLIQRGAFTTEGAALPFALASAAMLPPLVYLAAYSLLPSLRAWVASLDLALVIGAQTFRVVGAVFLMLWGLGQLPTVFALTAGLGDIAVGAFALVATLAVLRRAAGWQSRARTLVVVGLLDFIAAFATGILSGEGYPLLLAGEAPPVLIQQLPLALIPTFGVPLFIILHLIAWQKLRHEG